MYRAGSSSSQPSVLISALTSSSHWLHSTLGTDADPSRLCPWGLSLRSTALTLQEEVEVGGQAPQLIPAGPGLEEWAQACLSGI